MRISELIDLRLEDFESDDEAAFLKIQSGKGGKFRRVPLSHRLRRELVRYINQDRPVTDAPNLVVLRDGRALAITSTNNLFGGLTRRLGFACNAHKFRHTYATEYLRSGGEIERLRRILGHTIYQMVMRCVHLNKEDLLVDIDQRSPF